ncbi:MCP four helix bundle domain-containing protein [Dorea sp. D27]|uniref:MCP four helix bundle domain-containing protein n=1 Tax=Dorea sp. D27 TaxID=658665 RepID=UPI000A3E17EF|nr:MCP four helix bundle domain-containing protein [Dorea sp. D27]
MKEQTKLPKATIIICSIAVLFAVASSYAVNSVRATAQSMYEHPYTVTNAARAMRSRLLDMKRFVSMFLTTSFENEEKARELFEERYDMQNEAIESIRKHYLGSAEDVTNLRKAMDDLIAIQEEALLFVRNHTKEEILDFIDERVYPYYDALNDCLERIIVSSDTRIYELTKNVEHTSVVSIATALLLASFIIFLTIYSNIAERKSVKALEARGYELQDALLLAQKANNAKKDSSRHLLSLINNVLDMSKIDAGKLTVNHELFHMQELAESVVLLVDSQAKAQEKNSMQ